MFKEHLDKNVENLDVKAIKGLIREKREMDSRMIPILLEEMNSLYKLLSLEQKKELSSSLESLKKKSTSFRFWLGEK